MHTHTHVTQSNWTPAADAELTRRWVEGSESVTEISRSLGTSRNAVAGRIKRLGLPKRGNSPVEARRARMAERRAADIQDDDDDQPIVRSGVAAKATGPGEGVGMGEIGHNQCRWPLWRRGERPTFRACGCPVQPGRIYCGEHAAVAYKRPETGAKAGAAA
jgi:GcrA cell cycle regulator